MCMRVVEHMHHDLEVELRLSAQHDGKAQELVQTAARHGFHRAIMSQDKSRVGVTIATARGHYQSERGQDYTPEACVAIHVCARNLDERVMHSGHAVLTRNRPPKHAHVGYIQEAISIRIVAHEQRYKRVGPMWCQAVRESLRRTSHCAPHKQAVSRKRSAKGKERAVQTRALASGCLNVWKL